MSNNLKRCQACTRYKDRSQFDANENNPDGLKRACRACIAKWDQGISHPEKPRKKSQFKYKTWILRQDGSLIHYLHPIWIVPLANSDNYQVCYTAPGGEQRIARTSGGKAEVSYMVAHRLAHHVIKKLADSREGVKP